MTMTNHPKLTESVLVSLNGVTSEPMPWAGPFFGAGSAARSLSALEPVEAMLMGRRTYEIFSEQWPRTEGPVCRTAQPDPQIRVLIDVD